MKIKVPYSIRIGLPLITALLPISSNSYADDYYVDNELQTGTNTGEVWENAFQSISSLYETLDHTTGPHTVYIKATETPFREALYSGDNYTTTFYLDAIGKGIQRGLKRAKFYGSTRITSEWALHNEINQTYVTDYDATGTVLTFLTIGNHGVWVLDADQITSLTFASDNTTVTNGKYYYDAEIRRLYISIGRPITDNLAIEVVNRGKTFTLFSYMKIYGGIFRFALDGQGNSICNNWIVEDIEISHNARWGFRTAAAPGNITTIRRAKIHHNGSHGLYMFVHGGGVQVMNSLIYSNGDDGIHIFSTSDIDPINILNSVIYGNGGYGIRQRNFGEFSPRSLVCKNTISTNNAEKDFYVESSTMELDVAHNSTTHVDNFGGYWFVNETDIITEPSFRNVAEFDFHLSPDSLLIDSGIEVGITYDFDNNSIPYGIASDIGAFEYVGAPYFSKKMTRKRYVADQLLVVYTQATDPDGDPLLYSARLADGNDLLTIGASYSEAVLGDVNNDGVGNILDKIICRGTSGSQEGELNYKSECDLDSNGVINILDKYLIRNNIGRTFADGIIIGRFEWLPGLDLDFDNYDVILSVTDGNSNPVDNLVKFIRDIP